MFEDLMIFCVKCFVIFFIFVVFALNCYLCNALLSIYLPFILFILGLFIVLNFSILCICGLVSYYEDDLC